MNYMGKQPRVRKCPKKMVNIIVTADSRFPVDRFTIESTVLEVIHKYQIPGKVEIGVSIVGDRKMHQINKKYRGIDSTTNVLTFALEDPVMNLAHVKGFGFVTSQDKVSRLGDVVISYPQAVEDAALGGVSTEEEIRHLVEHGVKHLLGLHHQ